MKSGVVCLEMASSWRNRCNDWHSLLESCAVLPEMASQCPHIKAHWGNGYQECYRQPSNRLTAQPLWPVRPQTKVAVRLLRPKAGLGLLGPGHPPPFCTTSPVKPGSWKKASGNFRKLLEISGNVRKVSRHFWKVSRNFRKVSRNSRKL